MEEEEKRWCTHDSRVDTRSVVFSPCHVTCQTMCAGQPINTLIKSNHPLRAMPPVASVVQGHRWGLRILEVKLTLLWLD